MDTWRQWIRHRTASVNEYSTRYSIAIDAMARTAPSDWRTQSLQNKQGSEGVLDPEIGHSLTDSETQLHDLSRRVYEKRLSSGVAREQARKDLPLSTYTEAFWKTNLHNLLHFLSLRMDPHAQLEIRQYARIIGEEIVSRWCPIAWQAFKDYKLSSMTMSGPEIELVRRIHIGDHLGAIEWARSLAWLGPEGASLPANRERREAEDKLALLGIAIPWN
jgi:thymidylate synthase (FAD)